jgi:ferredoxin-NADP reductase
LNLAPVLATFTEENTTKGSMAEKKIGTVVFRRDLSPVLAIFRLVPDEGMDFPQYEAGQYIALRRENCRLTKKLVGSDGRILYIPDLDENGEQRRGPVSHSYSIASAPFETSLHRHLEFYVILHLDDNGQPGRFTESLFHMDPDGDNVITYFFKIAGEFTLTKQATGYSSVFMVGTGSGLAPFASMIKQLHYQAAQGNRTDVRYTLIHGNRGYKELGYHDELVAIEASKKIDFVYLPTISRPRGQGEDHLTVGKGRANNVLRHIVGMPIKEEEDFQREEIGGVDSPQRKVLLDKAVRPVLPPHISRASVRERIQPGNTIILTCGNPEGMSDIQHVADVQGIRFDMEEW